MKSKQKVWKEIYETFLVTGLLQLHQNNNTTLVIVADHCHKHVKIHNNN
jgi:hypothetical protein